MAKRDLRHSQKRPTIKGRVENTFYLLLHGRYIAVNLGTKRDLRHSQKRPTINENTFYLLLHGRYIAVNLGPNAALHIAELSPELYFGFSQLLVRLLANGTHERVQLLR
jgi:hypothetical protein